MKTILYFLFLVINLLKIITHTHIYIFMYFNFNVTISSKLALKS
jgi:hypothetical protein